MRYQTLLRKCQTFATYQQKLNSTHRGISSISYSWRQDQRLPSLHRSSFTLCRCLSSSSSLGQRDVLLPGNILQSPISDIDIPNVPFHELMFAQFDKFKDAPATSEFLIEKSYTYANVKTNTIKVASALTRLGYKKGDTIILFSTNNIDYTIMMLAASCIGVIISAANPAFTAEELARQIDHSESIALATVPMLSETAKAALQMSSSANKFKGLFVFGEADGFQPFQTLLDDDGQGFKDVAIDPKKDIFVLPYSSGTTGLPKGVMLTHHNISSNVLQTINTSNLDTGENAIGLLPLYHIFGMVVIQFGALYCGGHLHYLPRFDPESFLQCLQDRKINIAHVVPPLALLLAKHPAVSKFDISNLTRVFCGAAPLGKELTIELENRFPKITVNQGYGLTETSPVVAIDSGGNTGSVGHVVCNTQCKVVDLTSGETLGPNEEGEICMKGPQVMKGYFNNQEATDAMITSEGWLYTGDIGYYNEQGVVYISDRLKELIKYKGSQVPPAELEAHLFGHEDIQDVAVIGVPNEEAGELPRAYVVKKPNSSVSEDDLIKYIEERVTHVKRLRGGVEFIDAIPRNPSGKVLRRILKEHFLSK